MGSQDTAATVAGRLAQLALLACVLALLIVGQSARRQAELEMLNRMWELGDAGR